LVPVAADRGAAHLPFADLTAGLALLVNSCAPDPRLPWLTVEPTQRRRLRRVTAVTAAAPLLAGTLILDWLLYLAARRGPSGNAYRILARKNG
jgi:hypothetical protein